jgi:hypothetical protein
MARLRRFVVMLMVVLISACAVAPYTRVDEKNQQYTNGHFSIALPVGWVLFEEEDGVWLSKDGPDLQRIAVQFRKHKDAFKEIKKSSSLDLLPSELAEMTIAELKASNEHGLPSLKIMSNEPVQIAGRQGYALPVGVNPDEGLRIQILVDGFVNEKGLYTLFYRAPTLHYFNQDRLAFEKVVSSMRIN